MLISLQNIHKTYRKGETEVSPLQGVDLEIGEGQFVAFMGPSGSGKSTLLNLIAGIDRVTQGKVVIDDQDITGWSENRLAAWRSRMVGFIFQQFNLMPVLTAWENVELPLLLLPLSKEKRRHQVNTALELVGLMDRKEHFPGQLSGGQEQRVAIARAIATDPQIILADEPTGNLDRESAESVMNLLGDLQRELNKTLVLVTHDEVVAKRANRLFRLDKGVLVDSTETAVGTP
ncbi:MAG: ABC transporter ATP-binding protein [Bradymonadaceae bacterium]